ncbi:MAG TPA: Crp/Fnr family transcriptional regulator [Chloroflexota bacterium]|nr:Crp/Fnr family transcriptional regulator [Chloroflexota bacterium]
MPLFAGLAPADLDVLSSKLTRRRYARDEVILLQTDTSGDLYILERGSVRIVLTSDDGREVVLALLGPGEFFGELSLLDGKPGHADVLAQEDCSLMRLKRDDFRAFLRSQVDVAEKLLAVMSSRLRDTDGLVYDTTFRDVPNRLARAIFKLAADHGRREADGIVIGLRLTQEDLAAMIGSSRVSINRYLKGWEREGWLIIKRGVIKLLQPGELWSHYHLGQAAAAEASRWVSATG